jgi:hypothetical protein
MISYTIAALIATPSGGSAPAASAGPTVLPRTFHKPLQPSMPCSTIKTIKNTGTRKELPVFLG